MPRRNAGTFVKGEKNKQIPRVRPDGEMYKRPVPNPFSDNWRDGYRTGYDDIPIDLSVPHDKEWREGYNTGQDQVTWDEEEMRRVGSSNA